MTEKMKNKKTLCLVPAFSSCPPFTFLFYLFCNFCLLFSCMLLDKYFCFSLKAWGLHSVSIQLFFPLFQYLFSLFADAVFQVHSSQSCDPWPLYFRFHKQCYIQYLNKLKFGKPIRWIATEFFLTLPLAQLWEVKNRNLEDYHQRGPSESRKCNIAF